MMMMVGVILLVHSMIFFFTVYVSMCVDKKKRQKQKERIRNKAEAVKSFFGPFSLTIQGRTQLVFFLHLFTH